LRHGFRLYLLPHAYPACDPTIWKSSRGPMIKLRPVLYVVGFFLIALGIMMLIPTAVIYFSEHHGWQAFLRSSLYTAVTGLFLVLTNKPAEFHLLPREAFFLTTFTWLAVSAFAALPMLLLQHISYTDAFFETMSGVTTTGSTVLTHLEHLPSGILLWRSLLQWIGGIGFIITGVAILPFLKVGGMRLFKTESSEWSPKVLPRSESIAKSLARAYGILTLLCALSYWVAGMSAFDAVNHAMTTLSTGGYSTWDASFGHFKQPAIQWIGTMFMLLGSFPFVVYLHLLRGKHEPLWHDEQVQGLLKIIAAAVGTLALWLWLTGRYGLLDALRLVAFNVVSIISTTGYVTTDYSTWGPFAMVMFFYLTFVGGCSGSTAGGMKIFRFQVAYVLLRSQIGQLVHPTAVIRQRYNEREITDEVIRSIVAFSFFFFITVGFVALVLALQGLDLVTSLSGAATAVCNVGPGLGSTIGPSGNFASLPDSAKWVLSAGMLMGRLEIMTVLVLFSRRFWQG